MQRLGWTVAVLLAWAMAVPAFAEGNITGIRGNTVKVYKDDKGMELISTVNVSDLILPAPITSTQLKAPYLKVLWTFANGDAMEAWVKRFKVKTDVKAGAAVHCSSVDDPNKARVAGVRALGNEQCN